MVLIAVGGTLNVATAQKNINVLAAFPSASVVGFDAKNYDFMSPDAIKGGGADYNRNSLAIKFGVTALGSDLKTKANIPPVGYTVGLEHEFQFTSVVSLISTAKFNHWFLDQGKYGEYLRAYSWGIYTGLKLQLQKSWGMEVNQVVFPFISLQGGILMSKVDSVKRSPDLIEATADDYKLSADRFGMRMAAGVRIKCSDHVSLNLEIETEVEIPVNGYGWDLLDGTNPATQRRDGIPAFDANNKRADIPFGFVVGLSIVIGKKSNDDRRDHFDRNYSSQPEKSSAGQDSQLDRRLSQAARKQQREKELEAKKKKNSGSKTDTKVVN